MSLASQIQALATRSANECRSLWTAVNGKAATLVYNGGSGAAAVKERRDVLVWTQAAANLAGSLVIDTGITYSNRMTSLHIRGYNYALADSILNWRVNFYANTTPAAVNTSFLASGDYGPSGVRIFRNPATNTVVIVIDTTTDWDYPKIAVDVLVGHALVPDSELDPANWTASVTSTIDPTFVQMATPSLQRNLRNTLNLSDLSNAATALTNLGITATAAELNKLDGVLATTTELNYVDGVTSPIQAQLDSKGSAPTGAIVMYGAAAAPAGWLLCNGANYTNAAQPDLAAVLGTTYGGVAGTNFNVPDLRVRIPIGAGTGKALGASDGVAEGSRNANWSHSHGHTASSSSSGSTGTGTTGTGTTGTGLSGTATNNGVTVDWGYPGTPSGSVSLNLAATTLSVSTASNTTTGGTAARVTAATGTTAGNHSHAGSTASFSGTAMGGHQHGATADAHQHSVPGLSIPGLSIPSLSVSVSTTTTVNSGGSADHPYTVVNYIIKT